MSEVKRCANPKCNRILLMKQFDYCGHCRDKQRKHEKNKANRAEVLSHHWQQSTDAEVMSHLASFIRLACEDEQRHGEVTVYRRGTREFNQLERMYQ